MCRSYKAIFGVMLTLGMGFIIAGTTSAESLLGYEIINGENGGSFLPAANKIIISGGEVTVSGTSKVPLNIIGDVKLTLKDVTINSAKGAGISIDSGVKAEIILEGKNKVVGEGVGAGISVGYASNDNMATLTIDGDGELNVTGGNDGGAGIGGNGTKTVSAINGKIIINGGNIVATAQANSAGIGGGTGSSALANKDYKAGLITINGGSVSATGKAGSAGIGGGNYINTNIKVNNGELNSIQGGDFAAGIGGGNCSASVNIKIEGGSFNDIRGYESDADEALGGAAIGSGAKVCDVDTKVKLNIINGVVKNAVAGWGAAGIGNGAGSEIESVVKIGKDAQITRLYTDGERMPLEENANIEGNLLQVAFSEAADTSSEESLEVVNYDDESEAYKIELPKGYRAFATTVKKEADYSVRGSKYYAEKEESEKDSEQKIKLNVESGVVLAHSNLYPVESVPERKLSTAEDNDGNWLLKIVFMASGAVIAVAITGYVVSLSALIKTRRNR
ncbi:hypothetical protein J5500_02435 [Candidatus Saccharibacteria bacterium]|nr:hypothetical protein [Candidatus Saccharibacteria bacterium]